MSSLRGMIVDCSMRVEIHDLLSADRSLVVLVNGNNTISFHIGDGPEVAITEQEWVELCALVARVRTINTRPFDEPEPTFAQHMAAADAAIEAEQPSETADEPEWIADEVDALIDQRNTIGQPLRLRMF